LKKYLFSPFLKERIDNMRSGGRAHYFETTGF